MGRLQKLWLYLRAIPKTLAFNLRYFPLAVAIRLPVLVSHRVWLMRMRGSVKIASPVVRPGMIKIGFGEVGIFDLRRSRGVWQVEPSGSVVFQGQATIGHGAKLSVSGNLIIGEDFQITADDQIACKKRIVFGRDTLISWDCLFIDSDFHAIVDDATGKIINENRDIVVGDHVWFGSRCTVLKGTHLPGEYLVIAANTTLSGAFDGSHKLIGGNPPKTLRTGISWRHDAVH
ncbi:MAG TPA: hypothetical protein VKQ36_11835 [Ktedonobacterales bacterium]|nr:hypothetical protein [Ktedonobacterales bacterium]